MRFSSIVKKGNYLFFLFLFTHNQLALSWDLIELRKSVDKIKNTKGVDNTIAINPPDIRPYTNSDFTISDGEAISRRFATLLDQYISGDKLSAGKAYSMLAESVTFGVSARDFETQLNILKSEIGGESYSFTLVDAKIAERFNIGKPLPNNKPSGYVYTFRKLIRKGSAFLDITVGASDQDRGKIRGFKLKPSSY